MTAIGSLLGPGWTIGNLFSVKVRSIRVLFCLDSVLELDLRWTEISLNTITSAIRVLLHSTDTGVYSVSTIVSGVSFSQLRR